MKISKAHKQACESQGKPNGTTALGYGCGDFGSTPQKLPSFEEWLRYRDADMLEEGKVLNRVLGGLGVLAAGTVGSLIHNARNSHSTPPQERPAIVAPANLGADTRLKKADFDPSAPPGQNIGPGKGLKTSTPAKTTTKDFGSYKMTVERPKQGVWVFTYRGQVNKKLAHRMAEREVYQEIQNQGGESRGLSSEVQEFEGGVKVTFHHNPEAARQASIEMGNPD